MIINVIKKVNSIKIDRIKDQNYYAAVQWRDLEKSLMEVGSGEVKMIDFLDDFKNDRNFSSFSEVHEMWEIIKILDTKEQRKRKLKEIGL